ncbi:MAG: thymidylate synthase [Candidatus Bathyarchaeota archaeon]|nr:thymidylate synthase [Candidatus Bathyarchaeota archaeon]
MEIFNNISDLHSFIIEKFNKEGRIQECRRLEKDTIELLNVDIAITNKILLTGFASRFPYFFQYFADIRLQFMRDVFAKDIKRIIKLLGDDNTTRRAYMLSFDFFWKQHDPCLLAYHFLIRDRKLILNIYSRSCDYWKVFPYDIYSAVWIQRAICDQTGTSPGEIVFHISSLHIYEDNWKEAGITAHR